jgi:hypothetical protein
MKLGSILLEAISCHISKDSRKNLLFLKKKNKFVCCEIQKVEK